MLHIPGLYIAFSQKGRGVFSAQDLADGEVIEVCPVIILSKDQTKHLDETLLFEYYFLWPDGKDSICLALGYGSLYNHSYQANAKVIMDLGSKEIIIEARTVIEAGDEILIDYLDGSKDRSTLWFEPS